MGRPSDKHRSARRPGKRERARVKKHRRGALYTAVPLVTSAGTAPTNVWTTFIYGRKKCRRVWAFIDRTRRESHPDGEPITKAG